MIDQRLKEMSSVGNPRPPGLGAISVDGSGRPEGFPVVGFAPPAKFIAFIGTCAEWSFLLT